MKLLTTIHTRLWAGLFTLVLASGIISCNGGSSSGSSSSSVSISSLSDIPELSEVVGSSSTDASISALALMAVSGTPPNLTTVDADSADTLFWNGMVADVNTNGADAEDVEDFWQGEGKCRMAQDVGYAFQNIEQSGISICYLKNAPNATSGVSITSGDATVDDIFTPEASNKVVQVQVTNPEGSEESGNENIFIRVFGTSSSEAADGFAVDLWFCDDGVEEPRDYEQVRVNETTGVMTQVHSSTDNSSTFTSEFEGTLAVDANGNITFDPDSTQIADVYFSSETDEFKAQVQVSDGDMVTKSWSTYDDPESDFSDERKIYVTSSYSGTSTADLKFLSAGFATLWSNSGFEESGGDSYYGATEFQDTTYATLLSGTLFDAVNNFDFSEDSFWDGTLAIDSDIVNGTSNYSCNTTPDVVVTMDMSDSGTQAVQTLCEVDFQDMNFCDSESISTARDAIFEAEFSE
jgi:hypothetical protein